MSDAVDHTGKVPLTVWVDPPPEGMAWKQDARFATGDEVLMVGLRARPIVPATVMVEMPVNIIKHRAENCAHHPNQTFCHPDSNMFCAETAAARAAIARKPCPVMFYFSHWGPLGEAVFTLKRPLDNPDPSRRPCKHEAGHGGEHE